MLRTQAPSLEDSRALQSDPNGDVALVVCIAQGDRAALAALYDRHAAALLGLALQILRNRAEAEDLLHEVFLEVWRCAGDYQQSRASVRAWLALRTRSRALDVLKSARVSRTSGEEHVCESLTPDPVEQLCARAEQQMLHHALGHLPEEQREVVQLAYFKGLSSSAVAAQLSVPIGTVKSRLAAAQSKLKTALVKAGGMA